IEPVEEGLVVADIVKGRKFRRVQKPLAADSIDGEEVSDLGAAVSKPDSSAGGSERTVRSVDVAEHPSRSQTRARDHLREEAGLISELRVRRSGNQRHALDCAGRELGRKHFALLIADRLAVNYKTDLCMVAQWMEKPVSVRGNASRAIHDRLAEPGSRIECG